MTGQAIRTTTGQDAAVARAQEALLARRAPEVTSRRLRWSQGRTQVLEAGSGDPLLLLHGGLDNAFVWAPIIPALSANHRVLAVDLPGHGLADPFDYAGTDLLHLGATFLSEVLDDLEVGSLAIVGCSVGGLLAVSLALAAPGRVSRLVLAGAPPGVTRDVPHQLRAVGIPLVGRSIGRLLMSNPTRDGARRFWGRVAVTHPERLDETLLDADVASQRRNAASHLSLLGSLLGAHGVRPALILGDRWQNLAVPTLVLLGDRDVFVPRQVARAWDDIAGSNRNIVVRPVPDAGHLIWFDQPAGVVAAIEAFLGEDPPRTIRR